MNKLYLYILLVLFPVSSIFAADPPVTIVIDGEIVEKDSHEPSKGGKGFALLAPGPVSYSADPAARLSPEEKRLDEVGVQTYTRSDGAYLHRIDLSADNLGSIDVDVLARKDVSATTALAKFLDKNSDIVGNAKSYEFVIDRVTPQGLINFHQVVHGLDMPTSQLQINARGEVTYMHFNVSDPANPMLDRSTWMSQKELEARTIAVIESKLGGYDKKNILVNPIYRIIHSGENSEVFLVYETNYNYSLIQIDAISGELHSIGSAANYARECERTGGSMAGHNNCDAVTINGFPIFTTFRTGNYVCVNSSLYCSDAEINAVKYGMDLAGYLFFLIQRPGPTDYEVMNHANDVTNSNLPINGGLYLNTGGFGHVIGIGSALLDNYSAADSTDKEIMEDIGGHEWGHAWHASRNYIGWSNNSHFAKAFKESVADLVRALSSNNYVQLLPGAVRYLDNGTTWANFQGVDYYNDSLVLSNFFWTSILLLEAV